MRRQIIKMYDTNFEWYEQNMIIYKYVISITLFLLILLLLNLYLKDTFLKKV